MMRTTRARSKAAVYKDDSLEEISQQVTSVDVHESVERIPPGAFSHYNFLVHIWLPQGLREIVANAFTSCISLVEFSIPSSVETIGEYAFYHCDSLELVVLLEGQLRTIGKCSFQECGLGSLSIPASVNAIGESAFACCENLRLVMLREGLQRIGDYAFRNCFNLQEVDIPPTTSLGFEAFEKCFSLKRVGLANGLTNTGKWSFLRCTSIGTVSLPQTLTSIDSGTFSYCSQISEILLPEGLTVICDEAFSQCLGASAFASCRQLLCVEFQDGQETELEPRVFNKCDRLINISIPSSMESSVWASAFDECGSLERGAGGSEYIVQRLMDRFANHPVHEACYNSSLPTLSTMVASVAEYELVDNFGMTPFHIAVTAPKLRGCILECLLNANTFPVLFESDENGKTMMDYLLMQTSAKSGDLIDMVLHKGVEKEMSGWGLPQWRSEVSGAIHEYFDRSEELFPRTTLDSVGQTFAKYVKLESTSLLELALWNKRIQYFERGSKNKRPKVDRDAPRLMCGANIVIPHVLEYLGGLPTLTTSINW
ncbi:unnamed protein product [Cylindrotheca closterium]|uniref:Uncharacterized protein n=1 Tax=Cylindrotheca closterium TaxID=2856 RepID=A0AAD2CSR1_9STRA|nr:unnamed protein product [Cylindrotheca closterium]